MLDTRNDYESKIGTFENAIIPNTKYFRDLPDYLKKNKELFQDKDVVMFCTGEIRCEISSAYFKSLGYAKSIRKLKGGIHRYVEAFENGFFKGRNYVFDDRISMKINENILTYCIECLHECDLYNNCKNALCNKQYICCDQCLKTTYGCCSDVCKQLIVDLKVPQRPPLVSRKIFSGVIS